MQNDLSKTQKNVARMVVVWVASSLLLHGQAEGVSYERVLERDHWFRSPLIEYFQQRMDTYLMVKEMLDAELKTHRSSESIGNHGIFFTSEVYSNPEGFVFYEIPTRNTKGFFPRVIQWWLFHECQERGVDYTVMLGLIEVESGFQWNARNKKSGAIGFTQIIPHWHKKRMNQLGIKNAKEPYSNLRLGCSYLQELLALYGGDYVRSLTAYNLGPSGAKKYGHKGNSYAKLVLETAARIRRELDAAKN